MFVVMIADRVNSKYKTLEAAQTHAQKLRRNTPRHVSVIVITPWGKVIDFP